MSRLKKHVSRLWKKKQTSASHTPNEASIQAAAAFNAYNPDNHPSVVEWLETSETSATILISNNIGMQEVPIAQPSRQSEAQFRQSWNSHGLDVEIPEAVINVKFDQLRTVDILGPVEFRERNDSGLSLVEDFTRPPRRHPSEAIDVNEAGILELSEMWKTREGCLRDLIEEHAESCRKCWHESCWA